MDVKETPPWVGSTCVLVQSGRATVSIVHSASNIRRSATFMSNPLMSNPIRGTVIA